MNSAGTDIVLPVEQNADTRPAAQDGARMVPLRRLCVSASLVPILVCSALALRYAYDAPYWDEWSYAGPVARAFEGKLTLSDFWLRNNEHILFVPSLVVIPLARLTNWDMRYEIVLTLLFLVASFIALARTADRAVRGSPARGSLWCLPAIALLMFSTSQYAVWNWGFHLSIAMAVLFIVAALRLLASERLKITVFVLGILTALAATFSVGGGLSVWPAGTIAIAMRGDLGKRRRTGYVAAWLSAGLAASAVYLTSRTAQSHLGERAASSLLEEVDYVLAYLGGPLIPFSGASAIACGTAFVLAVTILNHLLKRRTVDRFDAFVFGLLSVGVTAGVLTAFKHAHEGVENAVSSRFLPWPTLSWCAVALAMYREAPRLTNARRSALLGLGLAVVAVLAAWVYGAYKADERYDAFLLGRRALIEEPGAAAMSYLHPSPPEILALREKLIEHRLTVFRE